MAQPQPQLCGLIGNLLDTPGAQRVVIAWVDPDEYRLCTCDVRPGEPVDEATLPPGRKEVYLVGQFALSNDAGHGDITRGVNTLRQRHGLAPLPCALFSRLDVGRNGLWRGSIKAMSPTMLH